MERTLRCTVCAWRGAWGDATDGDATDAVIARTVARASVTRLSRALLDVQQAYENKQRASEQFGMTREPPCPTCGHHTVAVRSAPSFHSAM